MNLNLITALALCLAGALLEGQGAGAGVKKYFQELRWPSYSPPLWAWYTIGVVYYMAIFVCAYRILQHPVTEPFRRAALTLLFVIVILNALWNLLFFRAKNIQATFIFSLCYSIVVGAAWYYVARLDRIGAATIGSYAIYLIYANVWAYRLWRLNKKQD